MQNKVKCILNPRHQCSVGQSNTTFQKEVDVGKWFRLHHRLVKIILEKNQFADKNYYYFDIGSGPGICENLSQNGISGSPLQFLNSINGMKVKSFFFEKDKFCFQKLEKIIPKDIGNVFRGEASKTVPFVIENILPSTWKLGLIYMDYNGPPDFNLLKFMANHPKTKRLDILVNFPLGLYKRVYGFQKKYPNLKHLNRLNSLDDTLKIKKNVCYKGPKPGKCQWILYYLTDGPLIEWKKEGWLVYDK